LQGGAGPGVRSGAGSRKSHKLPVHCMLRYRINRLRTTMGVAEAGGVAGQGAA